MSPPPRNAFTLVELLVVVTILGLLAALTYPASRDAITAGQTGASMSNLRQLASANLAFAADNHGTFCPAQSSDNLTRWHGARTSGSSPFDPTKGYLSPYLGKSHKVGICPLLKNYINDSSSWELGSGGYGYNSAYIGGTNSDTFSPERTVNVTRPAKTVMFTTSALAKSNGLQEYPYSEPMRWVTPQGTLAGTLQPSTHFRANGKALVAWCDGHVTKESPNSSNGPNFYGGDNKVSHIGWFGPQSNNGYWNSRQ